MQTMSHQVSENRYATCIQVSKRIRWDIDKDVIRGRQFNFGQKFLPDGLSLVTRLPFLQPREALLLGQIQARTYANMFALCERFIGPKMLEMSRDHWFGDQAAFESLVRFTDEELKHQALFRRIEQMMAAAMPDGYTFLPHPNEVAQFVLGKSTWAVLALTCLIEIFTQVHYRESVDRDDALSPLFKDVLFFHWREESQHAILDELEWRREDSRLSVRERDDAVGDLIALIAAIDGILREQAGADSRYFASICGRELSPYEEAHAASLMLKAYRWQYIATGAQEARYTNVLAGLLTSTQLERIKHALAPLIASSRWPS